MRRFLLATAILTCAAPAVAGDDGVQAFLEGFVAKYSSSKVDFFYVSPAKKGQFSDNVWIYWMTGNALLFVDVPTKRLKDYSWYDYKAKIRLDRDVVPTAEDRGADSLEESSFVEGLLRDCLNGSRKIVVKKKGPNPMQEPTPGGVAHR